MNVELAGVLHSGLACPPNLRNKVWDSLEANQQQWALRQATDATEFLRQSVDRKVIDSIIDDHLMGSLSCEETANAIVNEILGTKEK